MKKFKLIILSICLSAFTLNAQEATKVTTVNKSVGKENGSALKTIINRASEKEILKELKSLLKDYDGDVDIDDSELSAEEVQIESMGSDPLIVYAMVEEVADNQHELYVIFVKNTQIVSADNDLSAFTAAKSIIRKFSNELSLEATEDFKKKIDKSYAALLSDEKDLKRDLSKAEEDIKDAEERIKDAQKLIKDKKKEIADKKKEQAEVLQKIDKQAIEVKKAENEVGLYK